jgi:hypothetical protein
MFAPGGGSVSSPPSRWQTSAPPPPPPHWQTRPSPPPAGALPGPSHYGSPPRGGGGGDYYGPRRADADGDGDVYLRLTAQDMRDLLAAEVAAAHTRFIEEQVQAMRLLQLADPPAAVGARAVAVVPAKPTGRWRKLKKAFS